MGRREHKENKIGTGENIRRTQYGQERTSGEHTRDRKEHKENTIGTGENIRRTQ